LTTKTCTIVVEDEVNCRIGGLRQEDLDVLWDKFGIFVENYFHTPAYQLRRWDGKIRFLDKRGNTYTKILDEIVPYLGAWNYDINLEDRRLPAPVIKDRIDGDFFKLTDWQFRPYQVEVINALLEEGSGFAICATGSGKTSMCAALSMVLHSSGLKVMVIVPSKDLVKQTVAEFKERLINYDVSVGQYSGGEKDIDHPIVVATWQALQNVPHYMTFFNAVIVDEAHGTKAAVIRDLINKHGKHISHRYGCTGTFPKEKVDQYNLKCSIGQIIREVPARWLIDQGYLSEIEIEMVETIDEDPDLPDYAAERAYLTRNEERNEDLARLVMDCRNKYGNTLVLVNPQSLQQGRDLQQLIPDSIYLDGQSSNDLRLENYEEFENQNDLIKIASAGIAAQGISIDRIFCMILLDAGKSFVKCIQSVGRGLRRKGDKNKVNVIDVYSKLKFAKKHSKDRVKYYKEAEYPIAKTIKRKY
jgi:superfamily II DNA or RNA helicase